MLALFTIGETPWSGGDRASIATRLRSGELALFGLHAAADSCAGWDDFGELLGARFDGHPWTQRFAIDVVDADHPSTAHLPAGWQFTDELYLFRDLRADAHVLLEAPGDDLDMGAKGARRPSIGFPLAWCFEEGAGAGVLHGPRPLPRCVRGRALPRAPVRRARVAAGTRSLTTRHE